MAGIIQTGRHRGPIAVAHVINNLVTGGAQLMLHKLLSGIDRSRFRNSVIALSADGPVGPKLRDLGIPVCTLGLRPRNAISGAGRLMRALRRQQPDVVQTWMYHSDLFGGLASLALPGVPLVWNIRCGRLESAILKRGTVWIARACALASRALPARILCCSHSSLEDHAVWGYARDRMRVIPNGFDTDAFRPEPCHRVSVRRELGLAPNALLVGLAARFDGAKHHANFFAAARIVNRARPDVHFLLCGEGVTAADSRFRALADIAETPSRCHLLGRRDDMARIMAALDIAVLSSITEGFPNVIGEAMSCGVPCVATDAGDSRLIVGETGCVVPTRNAVALAEGILRLIDLGSEPRALLGRQARRRIIEEFDLAACVRQYEEIYRELTAECAA